MTGSITYTVFDTRTGRVAAKIQCSPDQIASMITSDQVAHEGAFDARTTMLDGGGAPVTVNQIPDPEDGERAAAMAAAYQRIAELDRKVLRALREDRLGIVPTEADRAAGAMTLQEIEDEIAAQRAIIHATDSNAT